MCTLTHIILRTETIDRIEPVYREYLAYMSRFFEIVDVESWSKKAVKNLHRYLTAQDHHIFIVEVSGAVIGFGLVNGHLRFNDDGLAVAEFYIQKAHEKNGHGRRLAEVIFEQFPGNWEVAVTKKNKAALAFWEQVVSAYTAGQFIKKTSPCFAGYGFIFRTS